MEVPSCRERHEGEGVVALRRALDEPLVAALEHLLPVEAHRAHRAQAGPRARPPHAVDRDAALREGADDADVREPARAAPAQGEAQPPVDEEPGDALDVARIAFAGVVVPPEASSLEPAPRPLRPLSPRGVHEDEVRRRRRVGGEVVERLLDRPSGPRAGGVGHEDDAVALAEAQPGPGRGVGVAFVDDVSVRGLLRGQPFEEVVVHGGAREHGRPEALLDGVAPDVDRRPVARQLAGELGGERGVRSALATGRDGDGHVAAACPLAPAASGQPAHHDAREVDEDGGPALHQPRELVPRQLRQQRIAHRRHRGRALARGQEGHLTDDLAPAQLRQLDPPAAVRAPRDAQPSADDEVQGVRGSAFAQDGRPSRDAHEAEGGHQGVQVRGVEGGEGGGLPQQLRQLSRRHLQRRGTAVTPPPAPPAIPSTS